MGISRADARIAAAAVCRDESGNFIGSSALVIIGIIDVATVEAIACCEGLSLAQDLMLHNFTIASDRKQVVIDIDKGSRGSYEAIICEIKLRSLAFNCKFSFEGRASNTDANRFAKFYHSLDQGRQVWLSETHDLFYIPHHVDFVQ